MARGVAGRWGRGYGWRGLGQNWWAVRCAMQQRDGDRLAGREGKRARQWHKWVRESMRSPGLVVFDPGVPGLVSEGRRMAPGVFLLVKEPAC